MQPLSVVIVCKNMAGTIRHTLSDITALTDDILVYDSGSTDGTQDLVRQNGIRLVEGSWEGFGKTKNKANALAKYNWILSLDADEIMDADLRDSLLKLDLANEHQVYVFRFKNFLGRKWLRFGAWFGDKHIRLFNRRYGKWNNTEVHEGLEFTADIQKKQLGGSVLHYTATDPHAFRKKMDIYAALCAKKYFNQNRKTNRVQILLSPVYTFIKVYFFRFGFLDGRSGLHCAAIIARYTFLKYKKLKELTGKKGMPENQ